MKIRFGYVSNSSTTSFTIFGVKTNKYHAVDSIATSKNGRKIVADHCDNDFINDSVSYACKNIDTWNLDTYIEKVFGLDSYNNDGNTWIGLHSRDYDKSKESKEEFESKVSKMISGMKLHGDPQPEWISKSYYS